MSALTYSLPTGDFVTSTLVGAITSTSNTATIGSGLNLAASNGVLMIDYDSTASLGSASGPETIFYSSYNTATGALTGITRGLSSTTAVAHNNGASVAASPGVSYLSDIESNMIYSLGYNEYSASQQSTTTNVDLTGPTLTVTVPTGRKIQVSALVHLQLSTVGNDRRAYIGIKDNGSFVHYASVIFPIDSKQQTLYIAYVISSLSGSHTYTLNMGSPEGVSILHATDANYTSWMKIDTA